MNSYRRILRHIFSQHGVLRRVCSFARRAAWASSFVFAVHLHLGFLHRFPNKRRYFFVFFTRQFAEPATGSIRRCCSWSRRRRAPPTIFFEDAMTFVFAAETIVRADWVVPVVVVAARTAKSGAAKSNAPVALAANTNDDDDAFDSLLRPLKRSAFSSSTKKKTKREARKGPLSRVCARMRVYLSSFLDS